MNLTTIEGKWASYTPYMHSALRITAAFMFMVAGSMNLFAFPVAASPDGSTAEFMTQGWIGSVLEFLGGGLLVLGLFTRPVAFILSGEMAVAYFQYHCSDSFLPNLNGGTEAVLYCFVWLYFSAAGAGKWSIDSMRKE